MSPISNSRNIKTYLTVSATSQPKFSIVRQDMLNLLAKTETTTYNTTDKLWCRGRSKGGSKSFSRLLTKYVGHTDSVNSVFINSNGSKIITGSSDATVKIWDVMSC